MIVAEGLPVGLGSTAEWDTRIDGALAGALMAIPAVKGVEIGLGFGVVARRGSEMHDEVEPVVVEWSRRTNRAGGVEGGMTNGQPLVLRAAVKPVA
nr:chorismate synthase [Chloroflexota bacterium]